MPVLPASLMETLRVDEIPESDMAVEFTHVVNVVYCVSVTVDCIGQDDV